MELDRSMTAFYGENLIGAGPVSELLISVKALVDRESESGDGSEGPLLIFDDRTGTQVDFNLEGSEADVTAALAEHPFLNPRIDSAQTPAKGGVGRPKLGVTAREITLLPRHWSWLETQRSGASATLRRLVEGAMKAETSGADGKAVRDAAAKVMWCLAGNLPGFEEASRALYRAEMDVFEDLIHEWPEGIRDYLLRLLKGASV